jgi:hypothetical protein
LIENSSGRLEPVLNAGLANLGNHFAKFQPKDAEEAIFSAKCAAGRTQDTGQGPQKYPLQQNYGPSAGTATAPQ